MRDDKLAKLYLNDPHFALQRGLELCAEYVTLIDGVRDIPNPYLKGDEHGAQTQWLGARWLS